MVSPSLALLVGLVGSAVVLPSPVSTVVVTGLLPAESETELEVGDEPLAKLVLELPPSPVPASTDEHAARNDTTQAKVRRMPS